MNVSRNKSHQLLQVLLSCTKLGSIARHGRDRVVSLEVAPNGRLFGCHVSVN